MKFQRPKKIALMYFEHGITPGKKCKDCGHLLSVQAGNKHCYKCDIYGNSGSEASDWRLKYDACGKFTE